MKLHKFGGRKRIIGPEFDAAFSGRPPADDSPLLRALGRAHRWQHLLETGAYRSVTDLSRAENISETYLGRVLRLTLLAPTKIKAIATSRVEGLFVENLLKHIPLEWRKQKGV